VGPLFAEGVPVSPFFTKLDKSKTEEAFGIEFKSFEEQVKDTAGFYISLLARGNEKFTITASDDAQDLQISSWPYRKVKRRPKSSSQSSSNLGSEPSSEPGPKPRLKPRAKPSKNKSKARQPSNGFFSMKYTELHLPT
jgi:hypothetical protein